MNKKRLVARFWPVGVVLVAILAVALMVPAVSMGEAAKNATGRLLPQTEAAAEGRFQPGAGPTSRPNQVIIQAGQLQPAPIPAQAAEWDTKWSQLLGIKVLATFDSSGPDAWSAKDHPLVYVTTEGPGYGNVQRGNLALSASNTTPGLAVIDGNTGQAVASAQYPLDKEPYTENHGLGASADGKWFYTQGQFQGKDALLVINARTLKVDKILSSRMHHGRGIRDANTGKDLMLIDGWGTFFALDPSDDNRVVGAVNPANLNGSGYLGFGDPSGKWLLISVRTGFGSDGGVAVVDLKDWKVKARINTEDPSPIWVTFSDTGKFAYVSGGHHSSVARIDTSKPNPGEWQMVGLTSAGTIGPYGLTLGWDEKLMVAIGKGEGTHNLGIAVGLIRTQVPGWNAFGNVNTDCLRNDHGILHPDPEANEVWLSCNSSFENVVLDLKTLTVKARLPMPNGGSTHNGAFVSYKPDWTGELLSDTNGLHGSALQKKLQILGAAAAPSQTPPQAQAPSASGTGNIVAQGEQIFQKTAGGVGCASCHGIEARGMIGPNIRGKTASQISSALGHVDAMFFIKLSSDQIEAVAAYLATLTN
ncbi:MAG: hypothetical protein Q8P00_00325 [Dehalococcoidia bacterium]|nr:hypothetical protein [Dehalococcoidia bacterium]